MDWMCAKESVYIKPLETPQQRIEYWRRRRFIQKFLEGHVPRVCRQAQYRYDHGIINGPVCPPKGLINQTDGFNLTAPHIFFQAGDVQIEGLSSAREHVQPLVTKGSKQQRVQSHRITKRNGKPGFARRRVLAVDRPRRQARPEYFQCCDIASAC